MTDLPHTQGGIPGRHHASGGHLYLAQSGHLYMALILLESGHPTLTSGFRWGFRMPLAEPGVRLSIRTRLSLDVYA